MFHKSAHTNFGRTRDIWDREREREPRVQQRRARATNTPIVLSHSRGVLSVFSLQTASTDEDNSTQKPDQSDEKVVTVPDSNEVSLESSGIEIVQEIKGPSMPTYQSPLDHISQQRFVCWLNGSSVVQQRERERAQHTFVMVRFLLKRFSFPLSSSP